MSSYTTEELKQALGTKYTLEPIGGNNAQLRVLSESRFDIAYLDLAEQQIVCQLCLRWHGVENGIASEDFPSESDLASARQEISEELQMEWENAGFDVEEVGCTVDYWYTDDPKKRMGKYQVDAKKEVSSLEEAVNAIQWVALAERETWL